MDPVKITPMVEDLEANIDDLEEALEPLLKTPLLDTASKLPLLDKAKLYVHAAYAIESLLYSTLLLNGVNAKEHAIFKELSRLKEYFSKIKIAELGPEPKSRLDKAAAGRFIKHALAGNDKYDAERAEHVAKEKARAALKMRGHIKFDEEKETEKMEQASRKRKADEASKKGLGQEEESDEDEHGVSSENEEMYGGDGTPSKGTEAAQPAKKKSRVSDVDTMDIDTPGKEKRKRDKKQRKHSLTNEDDAADGAPDDDKVHTSQKAQRKAEKNERKREKRLKRGIPDQPEENIIPTKDATAPRSHSETFHALLEGPIPKREKSRGKTKGKNKT